MNVAILNTQTPFVRGGAEILAEDLLCALKARGLNTTIVTIPFKWYPQQPLLDSILASSLYDINEFNGMRIDTVIALRFPMWLLEHDNMALWLLHQHRPVYDLWESPYNDLATMQDGERVRELVIRQDNARIPLCDRRYTISKTVTDRLQRYNGISSEVLYPPPSSMDSLYCEQYGRYFFYTSRITPLKRQALVIEALAFASSDIHVVFAGDADDANYLQQLQSRAQELGVAERITWLGYIPEEVKLQHYANCYMVIFPTYDEDYGYVTPEAMLSSKGVVVLTDAGGPLEFIESGVNGSVVEPQAEALGEELDRLWSDPQLARRYGENGKQRVASMEISWDRVVECLLGV